MGQELSDVRSGRFFHVLIENGNVSRVPVGCRTELFSGTYHRFVVNMFLGPWTRL